MTYSDKIKVSVIIPVYNIEEYIDDCVKSVLLQRLQDIEIVLVDDGSTDASGQICDKYANVDSRVNTYHTDNNGLLRARYYGVQKAKGEYIAFIDGDDFVGENYLLDLFSPVERCGAEVVCGSPYLWWSKRKIERVPALTLVGLFAQENRDDFFYTHVFCSQAPHSEGDVLPSVCGKLFLKCLIRSCYESLSDEQLNVRMGEDALVSYRCILESKKAYFLDGNLEYFYRQRATSMSHSYNGTLAKDFLEVIESFPSLESLAGESVQFRQNLIRYSGIQFIRCLRNEAACPGLIEVRENVQNTLDLIMSSNVWMTYLNACRGMCLSGIGDNAIFQAGTNNRFIILLTLLYALRFINSVRCKKELLGKQN